MRSSGGRARFVVATLLASQAWATPADAADPDSSNLSRAHDAYARGAAAYAQGDYVRAAHELATADALVPDSTTLRAALDAVTLADDAVLGVELVARAGRSPAEAALAHAASVAQLRFAHRTARIVVRCDGCLATIDGVASAGGESHVVLPGVHTINFQRAGLPETRMVQVEADETREVRLEAPVAVDVSPPPAVVERPSGASPAWFFAALAVPVALGSVALWSALDTANDHAQFLGAGCPVVGTRPCSSLQAVGENAQTRTAWLLGATGAALAGTAALGVLGIRWHDARARALTVGVSARSAAVRFAF